MLPKPTIRWDRRVIIVCQNQVYRLSASSILVYNGINWVPVPSYGGSGFVAGPGVSGNTFAPPGLCVYAIYYYYTAPNGCQTYVALQIRVIRCGRIILYTRVFLQGFYDFGLMDNKGNGGNVYVSGVAGSSSAYVDTITVSVVDAASLQTLKAQKGIVDVEGYMTVSFDSLQDNRSYFLRLNHRNSMESSPVMLDSLKQFDLTDSPSKAFGNNLAPLGNGAYGICSGYVDQNGIIEETDLTLIGQGTGLFRIGYVNEDINGDGIVEAVDYSLMENNLYFSIQLP